MEWNGTLKARYANLFFHSVLLKVICTAYFFQILQETLIAFSKKFPHQNGNDAQNCESDFSNKMTLRNFENFESEKGKGFIFVN